MPANKDLVPAANCLTPLRNTELFFVNFLLFVVIVDEFFTIAAAPLFNFLLFAVSVLPPFESFVILVLIWVIASRTVFSPSKSCVALPLSCAAYPDIVCAVVSNAAAPLYRFCSLDFVSVAALILARPAARSALPSLSYSPSALPFVTISTLLNAVSASLTAAFCSAVRLSLARSAFSSFCCCNAFSTSPFTCFMPACNCPTPSSTDFTPAFNAAVPSVSCFMFSSVIILLTAPTKVCTPSPNVLYCFGNVLVDLSSVFNPSAICFAPSV